MRRISFFRKAPPSPDYVVEEEEDCQQRQSAYEKSFTEPCYEKGD